jgi:hypothetical protein
MARRPKRPLKSPPAASANKPGRTRDARPQFRMRLEKELHEWLHGEARRLDRNVADIITDYLVIARQQQGRSEAVRWAGERFMLGLEDAAKFLGIADWTADINGYRLAFYTLKAQLFGELLLFDEDKSLEEVGKAIARMRTAKSDPNADLVSAGRVISAIEKEKHRG